MYSYRTCKNQHCSADFKLLYLSDTPRPIRNISDRVSAGLKQFISNPTSIVLLTAKRYQFIQQQGFYPKQIIILKIYVVVVQQFSAASKKQIRPRLIIVWWMLSSSATNPVKLSFEQFPCFLQSFTIRDVTKVLIRYCLHFIDCLEPAWIHLLLNPCFICNRILCPQ